MPLVALNLVCRLHKAAKTAEKIMQTWKKAVVVMSHTETQTILVKIPRRNTLPQPARGLMRIHPPSSRDLRPRQPHLPPNHPRVARPFRPRPDIPVPPTDMRHMAHQRPLPHLLHQPGIARQVDSLWPAQVAHLVHLIRKDPRTPDLLRLKCMYSSLPSNACKLDFSEVLFNQENYTLA